MSTPIHAQSISSLNTLLSNPPQYPRNPTHQVHESLVLYIVRVPGSKDVFLTPLKPPTKTSISIEAVQSSLYFLHVERPEDEELRKSLEAGKVDENRNPNVSPIQRKPLPPTPYANYPAAQRPPTPPKSYPHFQPPLPGSHDPNQAERHAARGVHLRLTTTDMNKPSGMLRKPVGARPMPTSPNLEMSPHPQLRESASKDTLNSPLDEQRQFGFSRKPVPSTSPTDRGGTSKAQTSPDRLLRSPEAQSSPGRRESETSMPATARITLIRRDPASGSQWNVGRLIQRNAGARDNPLRQIDIELNSPGYTKFAQLEGTGGHCFSRKVDYMLVPNSEGQSHGRQRSDSTEWSTSSTNRKPRQAYSFLSPWQGICSFSNGLDGRSLRCRHMLSPSASSMPGVAADVAELRFNLPWSILKPRDPNRQRSETSDMSSDTSVARPHVSAQVSAHKEQWRRSVQTLTNKARAQLAHSESSGDGLPFRPFKRDSLCLDNLPAEGRLSLDLGREKAGGGFKGHSAKLGKLIIDDEGLKMCDLVVAACMGIWWQHYAGDLVS